MTGSGNSRPVVLCILDGWGHRDERDHNAIALAKTSNFDRLMATCPHSWLKTSEMDVGLPAGQMGNSEVGHLNLGAGRIVDQDIRRIDQSVENGSLGRNPALMNLIESLKASGGTCHLAALLSPGGVHSHQDHIVALARAVCDERVPVAMHAFLDGRDTPPRSAGGYLSKFIADTCDLTDFRFATLGGRYYGMDRDNRWERTERAYLALVEADGPHAPDAETALRASYAEDITDEFVAPTVIGDYAGIQSGDGVLVANFRSDRMRQILLALLDPSFEGFARGSVANLAGGLGMTEYSEKLNAFLPAMFAAGRLSAILGEIVSAAGQRQLRIAETEKYPHVTFFFNGGEETPFPGEERILVPSPKVATYDLKPEMSAAEVTDKLVERILSGRFDFVLVNYANADMVGHTGVEKAAIRAIETLDSCLGRVEAAVIDAGGSLLVTADHGNAETMRDDETGQPHTAHTLNDVPLILIGGFGNPSRLLDGSLADVAPTVLELLGLSQPSEMTGRSLMASLETESTTANDDISA